MLPITLLCSLVGAQQSEPREIEDAGRRALARRISAQETFLIQRRSASPPSGTGPEQVLAWLDEAELDWADRCASRTSRLAAFAPHIWSWAPSWLHGAQLTEEQRIRVQSKRVIPAFLDDLGAFLRQSEPGTSQLLTALDLACIWSERTLDAEVGITALRRLRIQSGQAEGVLRQVRATSKDMRLDTPDHLFASVKRLKAFARSVQVEVELRIRRHAQAFVGLASVAVPGEIPPGFRQQITRLARAYAEKNETEAALAALDLAAVSVSGSAWSDRDLRELYEEIAGTPGRARFWTVADRRPFALIPSRQRFDTSGLLDLETGQPLDPAVGRGKILVLYRWTRGCGACLEDVARIQAFDDQHPRCLVLAMVAHDSGDAGADVAAIRERGGRFPVVREAEAPCSSRPMDAPGYSLVRPDGVVLKPFGSDSSPSSEFADIESTVIRMLRGEMR